MVRSTFSAEQRSMADEKDSSTISKTLDRRSLTDTGRASSVASIATRSSHYSQATLRTNRTYDVQRNVQTIRAPDAPPMGADHPCMPRIKPGFFAKSFGGSRLHSHHYNVERFWRCLLPGLDGATTFVIRSSRRRGNHYCLVTAKPIAYAEEGHAERYTVRFYSPDEGAHIAPGDEKEMSHHDLAEKAYAVCSGHGPPISRDTYFRLQRHIFAVPSNKPDQQGEEVRDDADVKAGQLVRSRFVYERHYSQAVYDALHKPRWHWSRELFYPEVMVPPAPSMVLQRQQQLMQERQRPPSPRLPNSPMQRTAEMSLKSPSLAPSVSRTMTLASIGSGR